MDTRIDDLRGLTTLRPVPDRELVHSLPAWSVRTLVAGEVLWTAGAPAPLLALLVRGNLRVEFDGDPIGHAYPGELLGEGTAFLNEAVLRVDVTADADSRVLLVAPSAVRAFRTSAPGLYAALLDAALHGAVRRLGTASRAVALTAQGDTVPPVRHVGGALDRLWRALTEPGPGDAPDVRPFLANLTGFGGVLPGIIDDVATLLEPRHLEAGDVLFLEGEPRDAAWLVGDGKVEVVRNVRGRKAERLAAFGAGALVGPSALVESGTRNASCVARAPGWAWRMDRARVAALHEPARTCVYLVVLSALLRQLRHSDAALHTAKVGPIAVPEDALEPQVPANDDARFEELLREAGWVGGLLDGVDGVRTVTVGDALRSTRRPRPS